MQFTRQPIALCLSLSTHPLFPLHPHFPHTLTPSQLTVTLRQKETTAEESRNTYILQLEKCNAFRRNHLDADMPALFSELQDMNARRINKYKELVGQFAECHRRVHPVVNTCLDNITKASDDVNAEEVQDSVVDNITISDKHLKETFDCSFQRFCSLCMMRESFLCEILVSYNYTRSQSRVPRKLAVLLVHTIAYHVTLYMYSLTIERAYSSWCWPITTLSKLQV